MSKQDYTPYNIYQKRKMAESATPLKSIYAKNSNMFLNATPDLRSGLDRGFEQAGGDKKRPLPIIDKSKDKDVKDEVLKEDDNLAVNLEG